MNRKLLFSFPVLFLLSWHTFAQDTATYCQARSFWVSNCYHFYKTDSLSTYGTFEKIMSSDDGQRWYGKGSFTENGNKLVLTPFKCIRTVYDISRDSAIKNHTVSDTTDIPALIFYRTGNNLVEKDKEAGADTLYERFKRK